MAHKCGELGGRRMERCCNVKHMSQRAVRHEGVSVDDGRGRLEEKQDIEDYHFRTLQAKLMMLHFPKNYI